MFEQVEGLVSCLEESEYLIELLEVNFKLIAGLLVTGHELLVVLGGFSMCLLHTLGCPVVNMPRRVYLDGLRAERGVYLGHL